MLRGDVFDRDLEGGDDAIGLEFDRDGGGGGVVIEHTKQCQQVGTIGTALDAERALPRRRQALLRRQNGGDYLIPGMQLRPGLEAPGARGFALPRDGT
mgnify:CR=1 FL=1